METNKIYCKLNENKVIQGYFICFAKVPKYRAMGCNFDESKDFENAIIVEPTELNKIEVNKSQFINGKVVVNGTI